MKKQIAFILAVIFSLSCFLIGCESNGADSTSIERVITHIEANELENALKVCESMNEKTLEEGKDAILACVLEKLEYYLDSDNWTSTNYALVETKAIKELKIYQKILSLLPLDNTFTNATTFISTALKLEEYVVWNEYYKSNDNYLTEAVEYMNQGAPYRNTSWSIAVTYYEKAYTVSNNAYNHFKNSYEKGMQEAAEWYKVFSEQIRRTINKQDSTTTQNNEYNRASASYKQMIIDYTSVLSDVIDILESFPNKLY